MEVQISQIVLPEHDLKTKDLLATPPHYLWLCCHGGLIGLIDSSLKINAALMEWHAMSTTEKSYLHVTNVCPMLRLL